MDRSVGKPIDRVDGRLKVTGAALYSTEPPVKGVAHAWIVGSTIARGTIASIDPADAKNAPGVLAVLTHDSKPQIQKPKDDFMAGGIFAEKRLPLEDNVIHHAGQHVAVVVAKTVEQARHAAALLRITYNEETAQLDVNDPAAKVIEPPQFFGEELQYKRGDIDKGLADAPVKVENVYVTPSETHNPMEPSSTCVVFEGDRATVYDSTQWVTGTRGVIADAFGLPRENVRVICPFVGGGFGCKGFIWPHTLLTAMAAKQAGVPVKLSLTRAQMFTGCGHRPLTQQTVAIGAKKDGTITGLRHNTRMEASTVGEYVEPAGLNTSRTLYNSPHAEVRHAAVQLNVSEGTFMRAPGETPGSFALESALDELAWALNMDPIDVRLRNYAAAKNAASGLPWSSNKLDVCLKKAADAFGWSKRVAKPTSMTEGRLKIGYGMSSAYYPGQRMGGAARFRLMSDGRLLVGTAAHDLGTGAYTVFTQIAADTLSMPVDKVKVELGDTQLPPGPLAGGSNSTATVSIALVNAGDAMRQQILQIASTADGSPFKGENPKALDLDAGGVVHKVNEVAPIPLGQIVKMSGKNALEAMGTSVPGPEMQQFAFESFGAHFIEVAIDPLDPRVQIRRVVSCIDVGRIVNPKTCENQIKGGVVMGLGMALTEETHRDARTGRVMNDNLADYAVMVNADIGDQQVMFLDEPDPHFNPLGIRGVGEIGITGVAAAVANAVYHATGTRIRELPITPDKLL